MIQKTVFFFVCCALSAACIAACSGVRHIRPASVNPALCSLPFTDKSCRYVYSLNAELPDSTRMTAMIVTVTDPAFEEIQAAILSLEGLVVFDATLSPDGMQVHRALPPFNRQRFAAGLMRDMQFIFMLPVGPPAITGMLDDGSTVCRYYDVLNSTVDVIVHPDGVCNVVQYSRYGKKLRGLKVHALQNDTPAMMKFTSFNPNSYALSMRLISVEPFTPNDRSNECKGMQ